jgi:hypothetical protein
METSAPAQSASDRYPRAASSIHTILVLVAIGGWAIGHKIFADQSSATPNPNRVRFYVATLFYEWLLFVLVVAGVRRSGVRKGGLKPYPRRSKVEWTSHRPFSIEGAGIRPCLINRRRFGRAIPSVSATCAVKYFFTDPRFEHKEEFQSSLHHS